MVLDSTDAVCRHGDDVGGSARCAGTRAHLCGAVHEASGDAKLRSLHVQHELGPLRNGPVAVQVEPVEEAVEGCADEGRGAGQAELPGDRRLVRELEAALVDEDAFGLAALIEAAACRLHVHHFQPVLEVRARTWGCCLIMGWASGCTQARSITSPTSCCDMQFDALSGGCPVGKVLEGSCSMH